MTGLTTPVWRPVAVTHSAWTGESRVVGVTLHAVRGGHTLCGLNTRAITFADSDDGASGCSICAAVPAGHATNQDLLDVGLTYRRLDYWTRLGLLISDNPGCGSGRRRTFPPGELLVARFMVRLTQAGIEPTAAARAARNGGWLDAGVRVDVIDAERGAA